MRAHINNTPQIEAPTKAFNRAFISGRASRRTLNHRVANRAWFGPVQRSYAPCPICFIAHNRWDGCPEL